MQQMAPRDWICFEKNMFASEARFPMIYIQLKIFNLTAENFKKRNLLFRFTHTGTGITIATAYSLNNWLFIIIQTTYSSVCVNLDNMLVLKYFF